VDGGPLFLQSEYVGGASGGVAKCVRLVHSQYPSTAFGRENAAVPLAPAKEINRP
jgi:hypothetical protein